MQEKPGMRSHSRDVDALVRACEREGCPICIVVLTDMDQAMESWHYEGFTDVEHRHMLIRIHGFCPLHTWQLAERDNAFQLALVYGGILKEMLTELSSLDRQQRAVGKPEFLRRPGWMERLLMKFGGRKPSASLSHDLYKDCPFCRTRATIEQRVVEQLVELLKEEEMQRRLAHTTGLCQEHFVLALQQAAKEAASEQYIALVACQRACLARTLQEIEEAIRKHDYRFTAEPRGDEMTAWRRAAELCAGEPGIR